MEIYTLEISFPYEDFHFEEEPWLRVIEVKEDFKLPQLHKYIQKIVDFDDNHLYRFYIGRNPHNEYENIPKRTKLNELYPITSFKLYYLFDFGDHWLFEIKKSRKKKIVQENIKFPRVIEKQGENPEQYPD